MILPKDREIPEVTIHALWLIYFLQLENKIKHNSQCPKEVPRGHWT